MPLGLRAAFNPNGRFDQTTRVMSLLGFSIPTYWLGLVMLFVFFYLLRWAPPGMGRISLMVSPPDFITGSYLIDSLLTAIGGQHIQRLHIWSYQLFALRSSQRPP